MNLASQILALLAAALHVLFFCMESLWFMQPRVHRRFGAATAADAAAARLFAFNQGFYNLFLATGIVAGVAVLHLGGNAAVGQTLVLFCCTCMLAASLVLVGSAGRRVWRAACIQGLLPLFAWVCWLVA